MRLLDMAEALLQNFEAMPLPKDAAGMDRTGKALLTLHKVMDTLHGHARAIAQKAAVTEATRPKASDAPDAEAEAAAAVDGLKMYQVAQNLRLQSLALKRSQKPDDAPADASGTAHARHHWP